MKKGFTLNEVLITMAVIGVIAALTIPMMNSIKPDATKMKYIKAYNALATLTAEILDDPTLYYTTYDNSGNPCEGLACDSKPSVAPLNTDDYSGRNKFPMILSTKLNVTGDVAHDTTNGNGIGTVSFTTVDGIQWNFETGGFYITFLQINVNPNDNNAGHNCVYSSTNCTSPNKFMFLIGPDGRITPIDFLGQAFLENSTNMNDMSKDRERAKAIESSKSTESPKSSD